ncbi:serine hydrolase [Streptomyces sp. NPDC054887]
MRLTGWLLANTTSDEKFRAGFKGWTVADKTGSGSYGNTNDVGIVWTRRGHRSSPPSSRPSAKPMRQGNLRSSARPPNSWHQSSPAALGEAGLLSAAVPPTAQGAAAWCRAVCAVAIRRGMPRSTRTARPSGTLSRPSSTESSAAPRPLPDGPGRAAEWKSVTSTLANGPVACVLRSCRRGEWSWRLTAPEADRP